MESETTQSMIMQSVDKDIAEHFSSLDEGSFMPLLPIYIHIARHISKIPMLLSLIGDNYCGDSSDSSSKRKNNV
jgi:hypothetical protein